MDALAERAQVGKALLYDRWATKEEVLVAAIEPLGSALTGTYPTIRDAIVADLRNRAKLALSLSTRWATNRLPIEAESGPPFLKELARRVGEEPVLEMRRRIHAAIASGELPPRTSVTRLLDAVEGAVYMHFVAAPNSLLPRIALSIDSYVEQLVDDQLWLACQLAINPELSATPN
jgi:AcrR family transcriptional regulator